MDCKVLKRAVDKIWWWHSIDLGAGVVTPGHGDPEAKLRTVKIPQDLTGKTVLDCGAWDGFFSFLAEARGATVVATDSTEHSWGRPEPLGFDFAKSILGSSVTKYVSDFYDLHPKVIGQFDIVFCFGLLYHLKYPYRALEVLYDLTREMLIIETVVMGNDTDDPIMTFYRDIDRNVHYFAPNVPGILKMLLSVGFGDAKATTHWEKSPGARRIAFHVHKV